MNQLTMNNQQIAYPDFRFNIASDGKCSEKPIAGENTFSGIKEAFENCFYILDDPDKKEEFESILSSLHLDIFNGCGAQWDYFICNTLHKKIQLPFSFAQQLQLGDIFSWDCLDSDLKELTSFFSDYEFEVMFLVTAKVYLSPNKIQFQVLTNVTNYSYDGWEQALIHYRESKNSK